MFPFFLVLPPKSFSPRSRKHWNNLAPLENNTGVQPDERISYDYTHCGQTLFPFPFSIWSYPITESLLPIDGKLRSSILFFFFSPFTMAASLCIRRIRLPSNVFIITIYKIVATKYHTLLYVMLYFVGRVYQVYHEQNGWALCVYTFSRFPIRMIVTRVHRILYSIVIIN